MIDITVGIPTYNGATHLPELLARLREQINIENISWEIIVVDNNSTDNTAQVVCKHQVNWPAAFPLKYYFEPQQGAAFARERVIEKAKGKFVAFLDDDNLPTPNWVAAAYTFGQSHPQVGAYGSQIHGDFEVQPSASLKKLSTYLAIIERGAKPHRYEPKQMVLPPGAGLVVRREAWQKAVPQKLFLNHQGRDAGLASEDLEVVIHIQKAGWEIWYNPDMEIYHKIPSWRLEKEHLLSVMRCVGLSRHHIRMLRFKSWQRPLATLAYLVNDCRKLLQYHLKHSHKKEELVVVCQQQLLLSILISPFFLGKKRYQDWVHQLAYNNLPAQTKNV
ncbi:MAG: hormogonium polysaccharide biosynthesis glycosyltransferase HpsE [Coleofasciculaceae cyanobacterium]